MALIPSQAYRSHNTKAQKGQIWCLKCPRFVRLAGQQCASALGVDMRDLQALLGSCFILICCAGYSAAQDSFFPLSADSVDPGAAAAAPKALLADIASPFSEGISEKKIFDVLNHVPATEHRMRGAHEIELLKKISPSVVYIQTTPRSALSERQV